jgi:hypothetical protein
VGSAARPYAVRQRAGGAPLVGTTFTYARRGYAIIGRRLAETPEAPSSAGWGAARVLGSNRAALTANRSPNVPR